MRRLLLTDVGDGGMQHLPVSTSLRLFVGASWSLAANRDLDLPRALDCFAFFDRAGVLGKLAWDLGNAYQQVGFRHGNTTALHALYTATIGQARAGLPQPREGAEVLASDERVREGLQRAVDWVERRDADLARADLLPSGDGPALHDPALVRREFAHAAAMLRHGARRGLFELGATAPGADRLRAELDAITAEFVALWTIATGRVAFPTVWPGCSALAGLSTTSDAASRR